MKSDLNKKKVNFKSDGVVFIYLKLPFLFKVDVLYKIGFFYLKLTCFILNWHYLRLICLFQFCDVFNLKLQSFI